MRSSPSVPRPGTLPDMLSTALEKVTGEVGTQRAAGWGPGPRPRPALMAWRRLTFGFYSPWEVPNYSCSRRSPASLAPGFYGFFGAAIAAGLLETTGAEVDVPPPPSPAATPRDSGPSASCGLGSLPSPLSVQVHTALLSPSHPGAGTTNHPHFADERTGSGR